MKWKLLIGKGSGEAVREDVMGELADNGSPYACQATPTHHPAPNSEPIQNIEFFA
jgi:hypothetical protein